MDINYIDNSKNSENELLLSKFFVSATINFINVECIYKFKNDYIDIEIIYLYNYSIDEFETEFILKKINVERDGYLKLNTNTKFLRNETIHQVFIITIPYQACEKALLKVNELAKKFFLDYKIQKGSTKIEAIKELKDEEEYEKQINLIEELAKNETNYSIYIFEKTDLLKIAEVNEDKNTIKLIGLIGKEDFNEVNKKICKYIINHETTLTNPIIFRSGVIKCILIGILKWTHVTGYCIIEESNLDVKYLFYVSTKNIHDTVTGTNINSISISDVKKEYLQFLKKINYELIKKYPFNKNFLL